MRRHTLVGVLVCLIFLTPAYLQAQTPATATVHGTVTDPTGALIPGATVQLTDVSTNTSRSQETNEAGQYLFPSVAPGTYTITVTMDGFRTATMANLKVSVAKSYRVNVTMQIGAVAEVVEVTAGAGVELQTTDAEVGTTIVGEHLLRMPTTDRSAASLLQLQPMVMPGRGSEIGHSLGGQVSGARADQSVFFLDGGDATSDIEGTGAYNTGSGQVRPMIPVPVDSIEEFRVSTTTPSADFGRSAGGQISFVTKRGTNNLHGSAYWYHQNDNLNANTWDLNRVGQKKPELKDNRYGFSLGGPIAKDKLFLFGHFEGRRFPRTDTITRVVPRDSLKQGILRFIDDAGNTVSYDLATAAVCGSGTDAAPASGACDPRGLGINPVVGALWNLLPPGNDPALGDGTNTIGFRAPADSTLEEDFFVVRLDYQINPTWNMFASYRYNDVSQPDTSQVDIAGLLSGRPGEAVPTASSPLAPRYAVWGLTGQISPRLTNELRVSWFRHWWQWARAAVIPQVPGTRHALQLAGEPGLVDEPINIDTQRARSRIWNGKDTFIGDNLTWIRGRHTFQFGGTYRQHDIFHERDDKVTGALTTPVYWLDAFTAVSIPSANRPPTCNGTTITVNCLAKGETGDWDSLMAAALGLVDKAAFVRVSDTDLSQLPIGTPLQTNVDVQAYDFYISDTWRPSPSFTLTFGLNWQYQSPPVEEDDKQTLLVFRDTEAPVVFRDYIRRRREAAMRGQIYNPELAWSTINRTGRKHIYNPDWDNFGPRVAAAWNPSFTNGFLGRLFGDRSTVFRGGYSLGYDRLTGVNLVMGSPITVGFGQTFSCRGPLNPAAGGGCPGSSDPTSGFRIGPDGDTVPIPVIPMTDPVTVGVPFGAEIATQYDLDFEMGEHHQMNFTIQRELPGDVLLELGWVGRLGRNLQARTDLNSVAYFFLDPTSGQTLAQAFDALAAELRAGVSSSAVTPQPWFENLLGSGSTVALATKRKTNIIRGEFSGLASNSNGINFIGMGGIGLAGAFDSMQVRRNRVIVDGHRSNYHAGFISLHKRWSRGLTFDVNYTWSKSLDQLGRNQQSSSTNPSAFNFDFHYNPSLWDRTHTFNTHGFYELPIGPGRAFAPQSAVLEKIAGGWFVSGIFTANSGLPQCVRHERGIFGGGLFTERSCALPTAALRGLDLSNKPHKGVTPAGGTADVNLFADPEAVRTAFRRVLLSEDGRDGRGVLRGLPRWNFDFSLGKKTRLTETVGVIVTIDFLNIFNHMEFNDPGESTGGSSLRIRSRTTFGRLTSQFSTPRHIQFGLRVEF